MRCFEEALPGRVFSKEFYDAVDVLIERGIVHEQKDGIVYDENGKVLMVDPTRCEYTVVELNEQIEKGTFQGKMS